jgi:hypothetical protein
VVAGDRSLGKRSVSCKNLLFGRHSESGELRMGSLKHSQLRPCRASGPRLRVDTSERPRHGYEAYREGTQLCRVKGFRVVGIGNPQQKFCLDRCSFRALTLDSSMNSPRTLVDVNNYCM